MYTNISSCIYNNGKTSKYFSLQRGVRQGDPLSPYLFIIAVDIFAHMITDNRNIKGFQIRSKEIKLTQYADDLTLLLSGMDSINEALSGLMNLENIQALELITRKP